jgi:heptosyltransferase-2
MEPVRKSIPKTLLVVKNRALGDSIMGLSSIHFLKDTLPQTRIIYGVPKWIYPLYKNVETYADEIIPLGFKDLKEWRESRKLIKSHKVDSVLELFQSGRTKKFFNLWRLMGGPRYVAHNHHTNKGPVHDQGVIKSNIQRDLDGAWSFFGHGDQPPSFLGYPPTLRVNPKSKGHIVLGVVATRETKMWPLEYYGELTHLIKEKYPESKIIIPLGPADKAIEEELSGKISSHSEFLKVPLDELPVRLAGARHYIGNDTGLKHICVALGIPTYTLFGPEPPTEWHPYDKSLHPYYFREPLECRTRVAHYCALKSCQSMICLNEHKPLNLLNDLKEI